MVRVKRTSHNAAKRPGSASPDQPRSLRPKSSTQEEGFPARNRGWLSPDQNEAPGANFRDQSSRLPRLQMSSHFDQPIPTLQNCQSVHSTVSPTESSSGYNTFDAASFAHLSRQRNLSPQIYTPTQSIASPTQSQVLDGISSFNSLASYSDATSDPSGRPLFNGAFPEQLAGIEELRQRDLRDTKTSTPSEFPAKVIPSGLQHMRELETPWSALETPTEEQSQSAFSCASGVPHSVRPLELTLSTSLNSRANNKPGRRFGPLSPESRQNANDVRKERSCLRCFVMKETCDASKDMCHNCRKKLARTWKLGCIRPRLMFRMPSLLPNILVDRLERRYVDSFIQHRGWTCSERQRFAIHLDIGLGTPLILPVREFLPVGDLRRTAYLSKMTENGPEAVEVVMYDLPVILWTEDHALTAKQIRAALRNWMDIAIQRTRANDWAWFWFSESTENFAGSIMEVICEYFQSSPVQHDLLRNALALSFINYVLINSFDVPKAFFPTTFSKMENPPVDVKTLQYVSPGTINLYIKMLLLPPLKDVVQKTLKGLEQLLLESQNTHIWRRDLVFCVSYIVLAFLGKTQVSVLQFAHQPLDQSVRGDERVLPVAEAEGYVMDMERELADLVIGYYEQFMTPSSRRKVHIAAATEDERAFEKHATSFQLYNRLRKVLETEELVPMEHLEPDCSVIEIFVANNTNRLCRKYVQSVLPGTEDTLDIEMATE